MMKLKERFVFLLMISACFFFVFYPIHAYCLTVSGRIIKPYSSTVVGVEDIYIFVYEWEFVKVNGLVPATPAEITRSGGATGELGKFQIGKKPPDNTEDWIVAGKEYLLVFSTRKLGHNYPTFFYGKPQGSDNYTVSTTMDPTEAPRIMLNSSKDFGNITAPVGNKIEGNIRKEDGGAQLLEVRVELYTDKDGDPVPLPYPFYRFYITDENPKNFVIGGVAKNRKYYVKVVANEKGYIDDFYKNASGDPKLYTFTDLNMTIDIGNLSVKKGGKISGNIRDWNNALVTDRRMSVQAVSYEGQQVQFMQSYVLDPNYDNWEVPTDWDKYYLAYDRFKPANGAYELKGLPFEDHEYILVLAELRLFPEDPLNKYATPLFYDGNENGGVYNIKYAKTIDLSESQYPQHNATVNFKLKEGACIHGTVTFETEVSVETQKTLGFDDPNIPNVLDELPIYFDAYRVEDDGSLLLMGQVFRNGIGDYSLCGLPKGDYIIKAYDPVLRFYPGEYYDDQPTYITAERISLDFGGNSYNNDIDLALGGMLTGRVIDAYGASVPKVGVYVNQINAGNPLKGYYFINSEGSILAQYPTQTDPNYGRFYIWGLPEGTYTIFVNGVLENQTTGFMPQFYDPNADATILANDADPIIVLDNDPNFVILKTIQLRESGLGTGGIISGSISLNTSDPNLIEFSANAFYLQLFDAEKGIEISNPLFRLFYDANNPGITELPYALMAPYDGDYHLCVRDRDAKLLPHFYNSSQSVIDPNDADPLTIDRDHTSLTGVNFILSHEGGEISGQALDPDNNGVSDLEIYAKQQIMEGPNKGVWKNVVKTTTDSDGNFTLKGLYLGTYIFSVYDPSFEFASMYYHPDVPVYKTDDAYQWTYEGNGNGTSLVFDLQRGGTIKGKVTNASDAQVYAYLMIDGKLASGFSTDADPNYTLFGLIPGKYILAFVDLTLDYLPMYYTPSGFTTDPNQANPDDLELASGTIRQITPMTFDTLGAAVEGQVNRQTTGGQVESMTNLYLFLYRMSGQKHFWGITPEQFVSTDPNGRFTLLGLSPGDYKVVAFGPQNRPISKRLVIEQTDLGNTIPGFNLTFPSDWLNQKYDRVLKLEKGLNLIAYPTRIPPYVTGYTSMSFLKDIVMVNSRMEIGLKIYSPEDETWKSTAFGNADTEGMKRTEVSGSNFYLNNGQGYLMYSQKENDVNMRYFPGQTALWLSKGINLVGNITFDPDLADVDDANLINDSNFDTLKLLFQLGKDASVSIQSLNAKQGRWNSTYWMWGRPTGANVKVEDGKGYIIHMKEALQNWYPTQNNP